MAQLNRNSNKNWMILLTACLFLELSTPMLCQADGMEEMPHKRRAKPVAEQEYIKPENSTVVTPATIKSEDSYSSEPSCEWKYRLSPGLTVWFFDKENNLPGPQLSVDVWRTDYPINFHIGVEGRHMWLGQDAAKFAMEWEDKTTRITYIRIPMAVEYMQSLSENLTWYLGAGPDILHTANDFSSTDVGVHTSTRVHYAFDQHWGVAVEAGYMWGHVDGQGPSVDLSNAFITPTVAYTF